MSKEKNDYYKRTGNIPWETQMEIWEKQMDRWETQMDRWENRNSNYEFNQEYPDINLFRQLVGEIDISKYKQKKYVVIVNAIFLEIFGEKNHTEKSVSNSKKSTNLTSEDLGTTNLSY